ncbi:NAD-dependent epimerase/dehydratase family protein [Aporhodopirellula aestuarii]|uniref:NAD(P)-dependent oxidoreductase n=1 Tax=Aporhodopirellula aestuarii TaxID=2950107 RepID=A0ABT0U8K0_9BACT|nr:NAD(P)-dependent oxidoreductase [Aporhodopirellula aestuarii]MCM2373288.1 NAD(P)-dependent oxidoreductase [Aporhodopirellula aestuarii]
MTRYLVTGANGFIGRHVVDRLLAAGDEVVTLSRSQSEESDHGGQLRRVAADVRDSAKVSGAMNSVDRVIHLAAAVATRSLTLSESINVEGTRVVASAAAAQPNPPTLIYVSSLAVAGTIPDRNPSGPKRDAVVESDPCHPVSHYGRTKLRAEGVLHEIADRLPITIVRPPCVFGPGDRNLLALYKTIRSGWNLVLSKTFRYSYISVTDLIPGIIAAADRGVRLPPLTASAKPDRGIYYLTDPQAVTFVELAEMIAASLDEFAIARRRPLRHVRIPRAAGWFAGGCGEVVMRGFGGRVFLNLDKVREGVGGSWVCDGSRAEQELSFRPSAGLAERLIETTIDYHQSKWL